MCVIREDGAITEESFILKAEKEGRERKARPPRTERRDDLDADDMSDEDDVDADDLEEQEV